MKITDRQICEDQIVTFKQSDILLYQGLLFLTRSTCVIVDARSHTCKSHDFIPRYDMMLQWKQSPICSGVYISPRRRRVRSGWTLSSWRTLMCLYSHQNQAWMNVTTHVNHQQENMTDLLQLLAMWPTVEVCTSVVVGPLQQSVCIEVPGILADKSMVNHHEVDESADYSIRLHPFGPVKGWRKSAHNLALLKCRVL